MSTITLADAETRYNLTHHDHLDRETDLPVVTRLALQGDVCLRRSDTDPPATTLVPAEGVAVVRGEVGGNTHLLVGDACYDPAPVSGDPDDLVVGTITVPEDGTALLSHPEHGGLLIAPGTWQARRQRERREQIEWVAD